jgi:excisionase family DNA binding protein|uniref:Helix-turn-helix domain-containing protein n=1 Tax=uncultured prokaryote TaxID=198431 RepID=A0A0H5PWP8_9ZZZZ|nr:hypothetical protein [uncultured prokaryote]
MSRLTPNAAAELCGKSRATILRAITTEDLPATKIGGQWAIEREALELWIAQRPQRARRSPLKPSVPPIPSKAEEAPQGASQRLSEASEGQRDADTRLDALEALCGALVAEIEDLRGQVRELAKSKTAPDPAPAPIGKRRLWPFSAKS